MRMAEQIEQKSYSLSSATEPSDFCSRKKATPKQSVAHNCHIWFTIKTQNVQCMRRSDAKPLLCKQKRFPASRSSTKRRWVGSKFSNQHTTALIFVTFQQVLHTFAQALSRSTFNKSRYCIVDLQQTDNVRRISGMILFPVNRWCTR